MRSSFQKCFLAFLFMPLVFVTLPNFAKICKEYFAIEATYQLIMLFTNFQERDNCFFNELKHEDFLLYNFHPSSEESLICAFYLKSSNNNNNKKDTKKDMSTFQTDPV